MTGSYDIEVISKQLNFKLNIRRNITILQGDSATGKTTLINAINAYYNLGKSSGVKVICKKQCVVLQGKNWEHSLSNITDSIVFIDEGNDFVTSHDFARVIQSTDNYYVIATREPISTLPYSINEIYGLKSNGKNLETNQTFNETYNIYSKYMTDTKITPSKIITEDSNSGYEFFKIVSDEMCIECKSANGKSKVRQLIEQEQHENTVVIVDGAAFGSEMNTVMNTLKQKSNVFLYTPESFEYLILKSGIIKSNGLDNILEDPSKYIESKDYFSWERYFTDLLCKITYQSNIASYNKSKLDKYYKIPKHIKMILSSITKVNFDCIIDKI